MKVNIIPIDNLYELIYNYGPSMRSEMSRMDYNTYKVYYKEKVPEEKVRMKLFADHFSRVVPSKEALKRLSDYINNEKVLELNASLGLWSYLLYNEYVDIIATDEYYLPQKIPFFIPIENIAYLEALKKYKDRKTLLLLCNDDYFIGKKIDKILDNFSGDRIILICEKDNIDKLAKKITGKITTVISRFEHKQTPRNQWIVVDLIRVPRWLDYDMNIYLLEKQNTGESTKLYNY
jgi:hypothetical protein